VNEYSHFKAARHWPVIDAIRAGNHHAPVHVQIILSDLCNQDCVEAGTKVDCPGGQRPIEDLAVGDTVIGPDGNLVEITRFGSRHADELYEIHAGGEVLRCTGEHPILTANGWVDARHLRAGRDAAVVRVLHDTWMDVPGGLLPQRPQEASAAPARSSPYRLLLEGIELERDLALCPIDTVRLIRGRVLVYNFACPPIEAYLAGNFVVHNCSFCSYRVSGNPSNALFKEGDNNNPARFIRTDKALEILNDCKTMGVKAIQFTGGGEPTVHRDFDKLFNYALSLGLHVALVTNGVKINPDAIGGAAWVRVSLDAGTEETYRSLRRAPRGVFEKVLLHVRQLATLKRVALGIGFVVTRENHHEVGQAIDLAEDIGADNIRISAAFLPEGAAYHEPHRAAVLEKLIEARCKSRRADFQIIDRFSDRIDDLETGHPTQSLCGYQHFTTYIGADLNLYRCCNYAYNPHGLIGSLRGTRLPDAWEDAVRSFRRFDAKTCGRCQFNGINRFIDYAAQPGVQTHEDFV
jgi:MoaA/NifB/PqqE/SkfB family radical SAM enzyme